MNVSLGAGPPGALSRSLPPALPDDVDGALALARELAAHESTSTRDLWETLATLAAHDLGVARAIEPHLDADAIFAQAGFQLPVGRWGVFAAEGGDDPLVATEASGGWTLTGTKPWCSLADRLDGALVTASGRLFAVALKRPGVEVLPGAWLARGLSEIPSGPVRFDSVPATPVGEPGWYLTRPGFAWGGIGVAACWHGGAVGIARTVHAAAAAKPNPFLLEHLGSIDELLQSSRRALAEAADLIDTGDPEPKLLAKRVRATVARACEEILARSGHALGPAPLALDGAHAKRVADLWLYVRQHHAEKDLASLGENLAATDAPW
ncbi:MAG: acyl-CoA dehydrogenase [Actinobacteria bacterium]|nr:acyl-CoA dehydrogenase [Actinomycetota bacterium]